MIRKVVLFVGGIETLDYFSYQMGQTFEKMGLSVFYFDLQDGINCGRRVQKFIKSKETAMLTFNFEGLEREDGIFSINSGYIWQGYDMPIYNILADHPYFYDNRFKDLLDDDRLFPGILKQYHHLSIDQNHESYVCRFYPMFRNAGFFPLAGTGLDDQEGIKPIKDRDIPILFTGNYTKLSFFDKYIHAINDEYAKFYMDIIEELISCPNKTVEEVVIAHCKAEMGEVTDQELALALHKMVFIDLYVRNYYRGKVIQTLVNDGFPVTVIGKDWEELPVKSPNRFNILPQTNSLECLKALRNSKVSVNVMPWFKCGAHDRVFNSILNGAVCMSDVSRYQCDILPEGIGVIYYDLKKDLGDLGKTAISGLSDNMNRLLSDQNKLQEIVDNGRDAVVLHNTWGCRARYFIETVLSNS